MKNSIKVILMSQFPLPYQKIGSWTTLYKNYLSQNHQIDIIVCPKPKSLFSKIEYSFVNISIFNKIINKLKKNNHFNFIKTLSKKLNKNGKFIVQVIDNTGLINQLHDYLIKKKLRENCYIQYFYHGFPPFINNPEEHVFFSKFDEIVFLTETSRNVFINYYKNFNVKTSVLHNGIDTAIFYELPKSEKLKLKNSLNISDKIIFSWCSRDTPQKGLSLLLKAWDEVVKKYVNVELWIIGSDKIYTNEKVVNIGKVNNEKLPYYFQISDCFLFPTQCEEGFGMSLIEALHCGNYCLASSIGGVPEVLQFGKLGKLVNNYADEKYWQNEIENFIENKNVNYKFDIDLYSATNWNNQMNTIIQNAKNEFNK